MVPSPSAALAVAPPVDGASRPALIEALLEPARYPGRVDRVELRETHISWVLLAGDFAYKVKKPVRLPFLDFSSLEARRGYCLEELRMNRATSPKLYVDVVPITGSAADPRIGGMGEPIEYAVRMRRFAEADLFAERALAGRLTAADVDGLALRVAELHAAARRIPYDRRRNHAGQAAETALDNVSQVLRMRLPDGSAEALQRLRQWTLTEAQGLAGTFVDRVVDGFQRECHGDLHLGNVVLFEGEATLFDGIEFSKALRRTDVAADVAFPAMDLRRLGLPRAAARFVNRYLEITGDYGMLQVLRFYEVYRALVRAKVALLRARGESRFAARDAIRDHCAYVQAAEAISRRASPALVIMHGPSGSGKTVASEWLLEATGGVRLRSDVERKRLHGLGPAKRAVAAPGAGIYGVREDRDTYDRLAQLARAVIAAGYPAIVDASFLRRGDRVRFADLARALGAEFRIASCESPRELLHRRVRDRAVAGVDASDATPAVLDAQLAAAEPLGPDERAVTCTLDTASEAGWKAKVESLAGGLGRRV